MAGHIPDSSSVDWCTPKYLIDLVKQVFKGTIDLDPCSNVHSKVGAIKNVSLPEEDGLIVDWKGKVFVNPPYGRSWRVWNNIEQRVEYFHGKKREVLDKLDVNTYDIDIFHSITLYDWIEKCFVSNSNKAVVIALIPAYVDTKAWFDFIWGKENVKVCFIEGRVSFDLPDNQKANTAPMACAFVYWGPDGDDFTKVFSVIGKVVNPF